MKHAHILAFALTLCCLWTTIAPAPVAAQDPGITLGLLIGAGGAVDEDTGYSNVGWQALFSYDLQPLRTFSVRAGQMDLEDDDADQFALRDATLNYVTLGGDFHFPESFYRGGLFLGLGYYDLDSDLFDDSDSAIGLTLGSTAEFKINEQLSVLLEISGHFADLDSAQFFAMAHTGLTWSF